MNTTRLLATLLLALLAFALPAGVQAQETNAPVLSATDGARRILPNDVLMIRVLDEPEMTAEKKVSTDGKIDYFFIGEVNLTGKTVAESQTLIRDLLQQDYFVDPQVYVEVKLYALQYVTVTGMVNRPGRVEIPPDHRMDVLEAIGAAGDFNRLANKNKIEVRRGEQRWRFRFDDLRKPENRFFIEPGDIIDVAESIL